MYITLVDTLALSSAAGPRLHSWKPGVQPSSGIDENVISLPFENLC